ncbi:hypothetical protein DFR74_12018 [Nocardia puris]|uniref:Uncharacterized protein n=1 Tax=Nocardia puris TaxID=208602 RepID=A0A366D0I2_9NOCA|nr:hypothetical protein DFR74_12018 [Nocardia puris]
MAKPRAAGNIVRVNDGAPADLVRHVAASTGLPEQVAARVVADVVGYFDETAEQFVRRRHAELQARQVRNAEIWRRLADELARRPVAAPAFTERQLRRIVYG